MLHWLDAETPCGRRRAACADVIKLSLQGGTRKKILKKGEGLPRMVCAAGGSDTGQALARSCPAGEKGGWEEIDRRRWLRA